MKVSPTEAMTGGNTTSVWGHAGTAVIYTEKCIYCGMPSVPQNTTLVWKYCTFLCTIHPVNSLFTKTIMHPIYYIQWKWYSGHIVVFACVIHSNYFWYMVLWYMSRCTAIQTSWDIYLPPFPHWGWMRLGQIWPLPHMVTASRYGMYQPDMGPESCARNSTRQSHHGWNLSPHQQNWMWNHYIFETITNVLSFSSVHFLLTCCSGSCCLLNNA